MFRDNYLELEGFLTDSPMVIRSIPSSMVKNDSKATKIDPSDFTMRE